MEFTRQVNCDKTLLGLRRICIEECLQDSTSKITYIRKITAEESFDGNGLFLNNVNVKNGILHNPPNKALTYKAEPMEVDLQQNEVDKLKSKIQEIEENNLRKRRHEVQTHLSDDNQSISRLIHVDKPKPVISNFLKFLLALIVLFVFIAIYLVNNRECFILDKKLQIETIKNELRGYVLHQDEALKVLVKNLERMESWEEGVRILPLIGTTGVGKTFTANIIKKHFFPHLVHEIINMKEQREIVDRLRSCIHCVNLVIIDNLKACDLENLFSFIDNLPKSHNILIVPIFNIHDTTDGVIYHVSENDFMAIRKKFDLSKYYYDLVIYNMLEYHAVEKWLRKELHKKEIDVKEHDALVKNLLSRDAVKSKGFKGLEAKLSLYLNQ